MVALRFFAKTKHNLELGAQTSHFSLEFLLLGYIITAMEKETKTDPLDLAGGVEYVEELRIQSEG